MKGLIARRVAVRPAARRCSTGSGCCPTANLVDPCYPERYNYHGPAGGQAALAPQVQNGHVLDQTIWNYYFEPGTDKLTRRPGPPGLHRPPPAVAGPDRLPADGPGRRLRPGRPRQAGRRSAATGRQRAWRPSRSILAAHTDGRRGIPVMVHDPSRIDLPSQPARRRP